MVRRVVVVVSVAAAVVAGVVVVLGVSGAGGAAESAVAGTRPQGRLAWRVVAAGAKMPLLSAVAAVSPTDVWAVGGEDPGKGTSTPVIVHWDGKRLRPYTAFKPSSRNGELTAIAAVATNDVWVVGVDGWVMGRPVVMHWDGRRWERVQLPRLTGEATLDDVAAFAANDVWAVGRLGVDDSSARPLVVHWNGQRWRVVDMRGAVSSASELRAIDGASPGDIWAVGTQGLDAPSMAGFSQLTVNWDGRGWKEISLGGDFAWRTAIDAVAARDVWSLASYVDDPVDYVLHWDGRRERVAYKDSNGVLNDVAAVSPTSVFAVGDHILHWDGHRWRVQPTASLDTALKDIDALSATDLWAVGNHVILRYSR